MEPRDTWVRETVPNIEWAMPDAYPVGPETPSCPSDLDGNGSVGSDDILLLLASWDSPEGDVNGDGNTDVSDVLQMIGDWGDCPANG